MKVFSHHQHVGVNTNLKYDLSIAGIVIVITLLHFSHIYFYDMKQNALQVRIGCKTEGEVAGLE